MTPFSIYSALTIGLFVFLTALSVPTTEVQAQSAPCNPAVERCR